VEVPITGEIDLHAFAPADVPSVVEEYLRACRVRGLLTVRLIHGRGKGVQRAHVRRVLSRLPEVAAFRDAPPGSGGWGATIVELVPPDA
jgi:DNA-nicking Smr family endonuclease